MNEKYSRRTVTIKDLWDIFAHHFWIMVVVSALCVTVIFTINKLTFKPEYKSTATLYILRQDGDTSTGNTVNDFSLALKVVNDCTYLLKSHAVVDDVIDMLELNISYDELYNSISTSNPEDTRVLEVTVKSSSPQMAKQIVDKLCEIGQVKIADAMGFKQVNLYEYGTLEEEPCNKTRMMAYLLIWLTAAVCTYAFFLLVFILNDCIYAEEDIESYLGLSMLGDIPNSKEAKQRGYGYYLTYPKNKINSRKVRNIKKIKLKLPGYDEFLVQEAYKGLRTNLMFCNQNIKTVAITSCNEGEGKTTLSLFLGMSLAELGKRVLVIEADMRKFVMADRNINVRSAVGLSEVLMGIFSFDECVYTTQQPLLHILFAGQNPPNPVELLDSEYFSDLINEVKEAYDYILIDTPPLGCVIDAAVVAPSCDGTIIVIGDENIRRKQVQSVVSQLKKGGSKILGVVRNNSKKKFALYLLSKIKIYP